jgi:hypothetical protein
MRRTDIGNTNVTNTKNTKNTNTIGTVKSSTGTRTTTMMNTVIFWKGFREVPIALEAGSSAVSSAVRDLREI